MCCVHGDPGQCRVLCSNGHRNTCTVYMQKAIVRWVNSGLGWGVLIEVLYYFYNPVRFSHVGQTKCRFPSAIASALVLLRSRLHNWPLTFSSPAWSGRGVCMPHKIERMKATVLPWCVLHLHVFDFSSSRLSVTKPRLKGKYIPPFTVGWVDGCGLERGWGGQPSCLPSFFGEKHKTCHHLKKDR